MVPKLGGSEAFSSESEKVARAGQQGNAVARTTLGRGGAGLGM